MLTTLNPDMLILARESRGFSQSELAKTIGVSQGKLSKAEKGEQSLVEEIFKKIYKILNYPEKFFLQPTPTAPVSHYYYRKRVTIPQKVIMQMEATIKIFRRNIDSLIDSVELPEYKLNFTEFSIRNPEELAKMVRYKLGIVKGPIGNLTNLLENSGIVIVKTDLFNDKIDGLSTISEKGAHIIFLNARMPNDRQRFSLAHELGHMLMHFDLLENDEDVETEANRFASELLLPAAEIRNELRFLTFPKLGELKRFWNVSMKSLLYRANYLKVINQQQYRNLQINYSRKGFNQGEPIPLPEEKTFIINEIIKLHIDELGYSEEELARILHLDKQEFKERFIFGEKTKLKVLRNIG